MIIINILWHLPYWEISRRVVRKLVDSKLTKSMSAVLMAIPLVLPVGTIVEPSDVTTSEASNIRDFELKGFTSDIVSPIEASIVLEVVKQPEPKPKPVAPVVAVQAGNYLPEPNEAGKRTLVKTAAAAYGIDWKILEAVWQVESGKRWRTTITSYAGATGPCQFLPSTWRGYAVDGNGDGKKDITYAPDCLFGSARLLAANGAAVGENVRALLRYNNSMSYVNKVLGIANTFPG